MAGIVNDNIVFPVLDLIKSEIRNTVIHDNQLEEYPSVELFREHPMDSYVVTSVRLDYESGYVVDIYLKHGSDDASTYPLDYPSYDYDYYRYFRLTEVNTDVYNGDGSLVDSYNITLNYDDIGLLISTNLIRIK